MPETGVEIEEPLVPRVPKLDKVQDSDDALESEVITGIIILGGTVLFLLYAGIKSLQHCIKQRTTPTQSHQQMLPPSEQALASYASERDIDYDSQL